MIYEKIVITDDPATWPSGLEKNDLIITNIGTFEFRHFKKVANDCKWWLKPIDHTLNKYEELRKEITRLQEKYDENGYDHSPIMKLQRIEQHIDAILKIKAEVWDEGFKVGFNNAAELDFGSDYVIKNPYRKEEEK